MPTLARIRVHPMKALDPVERDRVRISPVGGLDGDRAYAIVDADGEYVNGKRTDAVHRLETDVALGRETIRIGERDADEMREFDLPRERDALADWLSAYFGYEVHVQSAPGGELTDSRVLGGTAPGATLVSTATLETVASWFPALDVENVRRRFRANLEVDGVDPFWEDRLVRGARGGGGSENDGGGGSSGSGGGDGDAGGASDDAGGVRFRIGDVAFQGVEPVPRCVVPTRDPDTGEATDRFRERFIEKRGETFPEWADPEAFEHDNILTVLVRPNEDGRGETVGVGDPVEVLE